ncbi:hypothetical protein [Bacillus sp. FJAT-27225]|uniref:hypothetical protein n=1 Tax=Bacillus sp. FJAT-27225 TaxID=1743144 RepID=UPI001111B70C|nr:hypothetical protein [Bacillus sp. FJAT-27225]
MAKADVLHDVPYTVTLSKEQRDFLGCFDEEHYCYKPFVLYNNILTAQGHAYVDFVIQLNQMIGEVAPESIDFYKGKRNNLMET